ncbi:MAG: hypothetical protein U1B79_00145 [Candidatus Pacearchaeota archaeon]|nr:hypothetical protein [Nanoarchaeota archaeon]MDZ4226507.1 hypothetical protein [Candidatus Pacearchaeota archaeon]
MIKLLRRDEMDLDGPRRLSLILLLDEEGKGEVNYQDVTPAPTKAKPDHVFLNLSKNWVCAVSRPLIPIDADWGRWIYTMPEAIRRGNLFYDQMLVKYEAQRRNLGSLNPILEDVKDESQYHGREVRAQLEF